MASLPGILTGELVDYVLVAGLGLGVGVGELVSRYRDAPGRAVSSSPARLYILANAVVSVAALAAIRAFGWTFGTDDPATVRWVQVLVAGFGAMALFRSSLFSVRVGSQDVQVGPASFLQIVLDAADREVDRTRARQRADSVRRIMKYVSFEKALVPLSVSALNLMQNLPIEDQDRLGEDLKLLKGKAAMSDQAKALNLGLHIINYMGEDVLRSAVESLGDQILREDAVGPGGEGDGTGADDLSGE